ncbi:MAG: hypothetical protein ACI8ZX_000806 [Planctomycetota bacterium]|jgi:hypothetical protein
MYLTKLNNAIEIVKRDLGPSLLATDVFTEEDGTSIVRYNSQAKASALFNELTLNLMSSFDTAGFSVLNDYHLLNLKEGNLCVVMYLVTFNGVS